MIIGFLVKMFFLPSFCRETIFFRLAQLLVAGSSILLCGLAAGRLLQAVSTDEFHCRPSDGPSVRKKDRRWFEGVDVGIFRDSLEPGMMGLGPGMMVTCTDLGAECLGYVQNGHDGRTRLMTGGQDERFGAWHL